MTTTSGSSNTGEQIEVEMPEFLRISPSDITIGDQIGRGGFSTVHKALWRGKQCAAKVVRTTNVLAIQKEVAILSDLSHPNIIGCLGFSVDTAGDPSRCMILMELMESDLRHLMDERLKNVDENAVPFSQTEAMDILCQIATGMEYLHGQGVFHGDLKASNVLVSHDCDGKIHVKITDFGVSQIVKLDSAETSEEFIRKKHFQGTVGTRGYQAPEVSSSSTMMAIHGQRFVGTTIFAAPETMEHPISEIPNMIRRQVGKFKTKKPEGFYTAKADAYCFAMTCYEILSGRIPFDSVRKERVPKLVLAGARPELPHDLDWRLVALIRRCWDEKPSKRLRFSVIKYSLQQWSRDQRSQESSISDQSKRATNFWGQMLRMFLRGDWK